MSPTPQQLLLMWDLLLSSDFNRLVSLHQDFFSEQLRQKNLHIAESLLLKRSSFQSSLEKLKELIAELDPKQVGSTSRDAEEGQDPFEQRRNALKYQFRNHLTDHISFLADVHS